MEFYPAEATRKGPQRLGLGFNRNLPTELCFSVLMSMSTGEDVHFA